MWGVEEYSVVDVNYERTFKYTNIKFQSNTYLRYVTTIGVSQKENVKIMTDRNIIKT